MAKKLVVPPRGEGQPILIVLGGEPLGRVLKMDMRLTWDDPDKFDVTIKQLKDGEEVTTSLKGKNVVLTMDIEED